MGAVRDGLILDRSGATLAIVRFEGQTNSSLKCVNADGTIAGGAAKFAVPGLGLRDKAMLWDRWNGARLLEDVLRRDMGVSLGDFSPAVITGMSADGSVLVGYGASLGQDDSCYWYRSCFIARVPPPCRADVDGSGSVDGSDVEAFFSLWESSDDRADLDASGGVDGSDVECFIVAWQSGC
jgi:hypothetical protein